MISCNACTSKPFSYVYIRLKIPFLLREIKEPEREMINSKSIAKEHEGAHVGFIPRIWKQIAAIYFAKCLNVMVRK